MHHLLRTFAISTLFSVQVVSACSCFGPPTFCGTLDPPFPNPEWWIPDEVVLAVKLSDVQHGMDVKVIQSFAGSLQVDDTIRVWGDCGALCRHYPGTWAVGDTVIWSLRITDLSGNVICGTSFEHPTDYMISICGTYYLDYAAGAVSGPIHTELGESMSISQFEAMVESCLTTSIVSLTGRPALTLVGDGDAFTVQLGTGWGPEVRLTMHDVQGRLLLDQVTVRNGQRFDLGGLAIGPMVVRVSDQRHVHVQRYLRR